MRDLRVGGARLGRGSNLDLNLDQTIWRQGPRVTAGLRSALARFTPSESISPDVARPIADPAGGIAAQEAIVGNLVSRRINRHGVAVSATDTLARAWAYRLNAGSDYDFETSMPAWNAALALTFYPRKSIELTGEAGYTSSANASNAGSSARFINFFLRAHY
jgi:hypothetical protein